MKIRPQDADAFCQNPDPGIYGVLLYGENRGLVNERAGRLLEFVLGAKDDPFRLSDVSPNQLKNNEILLPDEMKAATLMGGRRVIRVTEAKNGDAKQLEAALDAAQEGDALLVVQTGPQGPRDGLRKLFESHKIGAAVPCYMEEARDLERLMREVLGSAGTKINREAQDLLLSRLGNDRELARRELEKVALYAGGEDLDVEDIRELVGDAVEFDFDDICYAVFSGEQAYLDQAIDRLFAAKGNPVSLLNSVVRHGHRLHLVTSHIHQGQDVDTALKSLRPPVFFKRKAQFGAQARKWRSDRLANALQILLQAEGQCKTTGLPAETICRRALMRVAAAAR